MYSINDWDYLFNEYPHVPHDPDEEADLREIGHITRNSRWYGVLMARK